MWTLEKAERLYLKPIDGSSVQFPECGLHEPSGGEGTKTLTKTKTKTWN